AKLSSRLAVMRILPPCEAPLGAGSGIRFCVSFRRQLSPNRMWPLEIRQSSAKKCDLRITSGVAADYGTAHFYGFAVLRPLTFCIWFLNLYQCAPTVPRF